MTSARAPGRGQLAKRWAVARRLVDEGFGGQLGRAVAIPFYSRTMSLGLWRDLAAALGTPLPRGKVVVRRLHESDDLSFLEPTPAMKGPEALFVVGVDVGLRRADRHVIAAGSDRARPQGG
jgi:hypothetical protein